MILSQSAEYAIRAVVYLARGRNGRFAGVNEVSAATGVPASYLAKVLGQLARAGVLRSTRGPSGGFRLGTDPELIALEDVVDVFDEVEPRRCLLGSGVCGEVPSCPVHQLWTPVATRLREFLSTTTIADLSGTNSPIAGGAR